MVMGGEWAQKDARCMPSARLARYRSPTAAIGMHLDGVHKKRIDCIRNCTSSSG